MNSLEWAGLTSHTKVNSQELFPDTLGNQLESSSAGKCHFSLPGYISWTVIAVGGQTPPKWGLRPGSVGM